MSTTNKDPGTPSAAFASTHAFFQRFTDDSYLVEEPVASEALATPAPAPTSAPAKEVEINFEPEVKAAPQLPTSALNMAKLAEEVPTATLTLTSDSLEVDLHFIRMHSDEVTDRNGKFKILRFLLPRSTAVRIKASNNLSMTLKGRTFKVTFLGDMHDFGGLFPFKLITFIEAPTAE